MSNWVTRHSHSSVPLTQRVQISGPQSKLQHDSFGLNCVFKNMTQYFNKLNQDIFQIKLILIFPPSLGKCIKISTILNSHSHKMQDAQSQVAAVLLYGARPSAGRNPTIRSPPLCELSASAQVIKSEK